MVRTLLGYTALWGIIKQAAAALVQVEANRQLQAELDAVRAAKAAADAATEGHGREVVPARPC